MLIHNKRLHPRRPGERGEHYSGCVLHEIEQQQHDRQANSMSPTNGCCTSSSRYSSMSSLNHHRHRTMSASPTNFFLSRTTPPPSSFSLSSKRPVFSTPKRNSFGAFSTASVFSNSSSVLDSDDSMAPRTNNESKITNKVKSKSTICLNSSNGGKLHSKPNCSVHFESYDSPDAIIANLFPDIDFKETTYLRKGHGAAEMAKRKNNSKFGAANYRSASALANYGSDNRKTRSCSTSSDTSSQHRINQRPSLSTGRLASIERDFEIMRYPLTGRRFLFFFFIFIVSTRPLHPLTMIHNFQFSFQFSSLNQSGNATNLSNIGNAAKPTSNGNTALNDSMKMNNNTSNGSINDTHNKTFNIDEVS